AEVAEKARDFEDDEAKEALAPPRAEINPEPRLPEPPVPAKPTPIKPEPRPETKPESKPEPKSTPVAEKPAPEKPAPARETEKPKAAKTADKTITKFVVFSREKGATVRLTGSSPIQPKSMLLENPMRLVIDLNGDWKFPDNPGIPKNDLISGIRVSNTGNRVVFDLKEKPRVWRLIPSKSADSFDVRVDK
ncbi:MAG: AMIN domain-containing protein, partial [Desulfovibrio sp.]|nr:AMIN domain-containing protein [Desulfovibrio sp.]